MHQVNKQTMTFSCHNGILTDCCRWNGVLAVKLLLEQRSMLLLSHYITDTKRSNAKTYLTNVSSMSVLNLHSVFFPARYSMHDYAELYTGHFIVFTSNIFVELTLLLCTDVTSEDSGHIGCRISVDNERLSNFSEFLVSGMCFFF